MTRRKRPSAVCHPDRPHESHGLCKQCAGAAYHGSAKYLARRRAQRKEPLRPKQRSATCHPDRKHVAKGLCEQCYMLAYSRTPRQKSRRAVHAASPEGKAARTLYEATPARRAARAIYERTPKRRAARRAREATPRRKAYSADYWASPRGVEVRTTYETSEKGRATSARRARERRKIDIPFRLKCRLRGGLATAIRNGQKAGSAVRDLGCSIEHLKLHLELFWDEGMSWENYGNRRGQWSIDHIKPLSRFDLTDRTQFVEANHYLNLQPLWHSDNVRKGDKLQCQ